MAYVLLGIDVLPVVVVVSRLRRPGGVNQDFTREPVRCNRVMFGFAFSFGEGPLDWSRRKKSVRVACDCGIGSETPTIFPSDDRPRKCDP